MSRIFSYPKPEDVLPYESVNPRPLHPLSPPTSKRVPGLPLGAARRANSDNASSIIPGYTLSTHIFQAAHPRTKCKTGPTPQFPSASPTRKQDISAAGRELEALREDSAETVYDNSSSEEPLWIVTNRFITQNITGKRNDSSERGVTLTFMHANGFHKEIWEETLKAMIKHHPTFRNTVDEIWLFDAVNQGDSAIINEGHLGNIFSWADHARDLQQFLLYYLPDKVEAKLPTLLSALSKQASDTRRARGFENRQLVAIGHSFGGTTTIRAAIDTPVLFDRVVLVDPVIHSPALFSAVLSNFVPSSATIGRRVTWPSREEALESFKKSSFFQKWDPKVLEAYVNYGIGEDAATAASGGVGLKTSSYQEAAVFAERQLAMDSWELLPQLDDRIELFWIMNGKETKPGVVDQGLPNSVWRRELTVWRREINTSHIRIRDSGHLIPQTMPDDLGNVLGKFVLERYSPNHKIAARL